MLNDHTPDFTGLLVDEGRFYLTEILGEGNYGVVYKALDTTTNPTSPTFYAIKCLGLAVPNTNQGHTQDEREIKLHALCSSHPNVVTLHHRFCHEGRLFIALELSAGGHLFDAISLSVFRQNDELVRAVFLQLVDAVRFCHERGVYHRDLKPENILCGAGGEGVRVADFGLATERGHPSRSAGGSYAYMTPESLTPGAAHDPRQSDIWALGIVLLNMMSGLYPWRKALDTDAGFEAFLTDDNYLRRVFPISDPLNDLLERCFRPVANKRPTLIQLRTEIIAMERLFAVTSEAQPEASPDLLRPTCHSAPPSISTASFNFSSALAPSTCPSSTPPSLFPSASFDSTALRPTSGVYLTTTKPGQAHKNSMAPAPSPYTQQIAGIGSPYAPLPPSKNIVRRILRWMKKKTRVIALNSMKRKRTNVRV
ncbi:kinase-like domain-containing protein [Mycena metata]|uniref:Kinase-like domain-containing protein n=1 Tax=Mycena metata TaxID=1033252 RepID=A0AAD7JUW3_9AGAR|nr:kinase-like domain-containing protein [Mycena metata]